MPNVASYDGEQDVTYTSFDKVRSISQGTYTLDVSYGANRQRVRQTLSNGNNTKTKRYFTPLYEVVSENGATKKVHYLTSSTGLFAIFAVDSNNNGTMSYVIKDHQGSMYATVTGNTVERYSFDAWGRRRNPQTLSYDNVTTSFDRGYTLHEHYDDFGLINMNGRLYDPLVGRMLSPDIVIQDEQNSQAYNRYSYCFNNPLKFTDPSGYVVEDDWYVNKNGIVVWDDNVTNKGNTPDGGTYIGHYDKDILTYYGLREQYDAISMKRIGFALNGVSMDYDHNGNLYPNQSPWLVPTFPTDKVKGYLTTSVNVSYNTDEATDTNKNGKTFVGVLFNFIFTQSSKSFNFQGYAGVYYENELKESRLEYRNEATIEKTDYKYTKTQILIPAEDITTKNNLLKAQITAGAVNANLLFSPRPVKMIWDLTPSDLNRFTFKYYFLYEK